MVSKNIIIIILIFVLVGTIVYFVYNYQNEHMTILSKQPEEKRVRFNNIVKYNVYDNNTTSGSEQKYASSSRRNQLCSPTPIENDISPSLTQKCKRSKKIINVDEILSRSNLSPNNSSEKSTTSPNKYCYKANKQRPITNDNLNDESDAPDICDISDVEDDSADVVLTNSNILPSNLELDPEETWDASFGLPLMSKEEKKNYFARMQKNHKKYEKSMGEFGQYQMDRSTVIQTDTTINPFKPDHRSDTLKGRRIKDIYDEQVSGPKAKPKKVLKKNKNMTVYENESEMNGGIIEGTNMYGFDGICDDYKTAAFGNEF